YSKTVNSKLSPQILSEGVNFIYDADEFADLGVKYGATVKTNDDVPDEEIRNIFLAKNAGFAVGDSNEIFINLPFIESKLEELYQNPNLKVKNGNDSIPSIISYILFHEFGHLDEVRGQDMPISPLSFSTKS